ncbi:hypothetical protein DYU05_18775 [Mucilaginibacter terrenus]|uniref:Uncharacterized protein n=1 Tax=Mucilaginibacter terrenus TaxID=2482727 RepID=A0A3E2NLL4_9SPHI|nr:hypothetical protein [Mucilaginibacter terrenus]RFZ81862.1 hypothetical protein DYU05_18775 [Mucilaginibacter terrenus]
MDFILSVLSGAIGGLIILVFQKAWEFKDAKDQELKEQEAARQKLIISHDIHKRPVESKIVEHLLPGTSIEKMKRLLGVPDFTTYGKIFTEVSENPMDTNTYLYEFGNAHLLLTSQDGVSTDSVTISTKFDKDYPVEFIFPYLLEKDSAALGSMKLEKHLIDYVEKAEVNKTMRDAYFCIETYFGRAGRYHYYTFFGQDSDKVAEYFKDPDLKHLVNGSINSYCISGLSNFAPYISPFW